MFIFSTSTTLGGRSSTSGTDWCNFPANQPSTTVMRFSVSVPVCRREGTGGRRGRGEQKWYDIQHLYGVQCHSAVMCVVLVEI